MIFLIHPFKVGTAALLNVPASLEKVLKALIAQGYDLGERGEDLEGEALVAALKVSRHETHITVLNSRTFVVLCLLFSLSKSSGEIVVIRQFFSRCVHARLAATLCYTHNLVCNEGRPKQ